MKLDKNILIKNITGILCGALILCFLLPFIKVNVDVSTALGSASAESPAMNGIKIITEGGFWGIVYFLMPVLILAVSYIHALEAYKKYICLGASAAGLLLLFSIPGQLSTSASSEGAAQATVEMSVKYQIGFWLMLVLLIALTALSVIRFFNLKGNKVFEAVNMADETSATENDREIKLPHINTEKISSFTQNVAETVSGQIKNITENMANKAASQSNEQGTAETQQTQTTKQPVTKQTQTQKASSMQMKSAPVHADSYVPTAEAKKEPEEIMEHLKKLFELKETGILTEEEFTAKKQEMLKKM